MSDIEFIEGLSFKAPNDRAPEYVKAKGWIKNAELIDFLKARTAKGEESTNFDVKVSQGGKWYAAVDSWKPNGDSKPSGNSSGSARPPRRESKQNDSTPDDRFGDEIPFVSDRGHF